MWDGQGNYEGEVGVANQSNCGVKYMNGSKRSGVEMEKIH